MDMAKPRGDKKVNTSQGLQFAYFQVVAVLSQPLPSPLLIFHINSTPLLLLSINMLVSYASLLFDNSTLCPSEGFYLHIMFFQRLALTKLMLKFKLNLKSSYLFKLPSNFSEIIKATTPVQTAGFNLILITFSNFHSRQISLG